MNTILRVARAIVVPLRAIVAFPLRARRENASLSCKRVAAQACLPAAITSVLLGLTPTTGASASRPGLHEEIESAAHRAMMSLVLVDGRAVTGQFYGFVGDWRDTVDSPIRYEAWRQAHPAGLPRLGESMIVITTTGDTLGGRFDGVGPGLIALTSGNPSFDNSFAFSMLRDARSDSMGSGLSWTDRQQRMLEAPQLIGVGLKMNDRVVIVRRASIDSVLGIGAERSSDGGSSILLFALGIGAVVGMIALCSSAGTSAGNSFGDNFSSCGDFSSLGDLGTCEKSERVGGSADRAFGSSNVSRGLQPSARGETRRP